MDDIVSKILVSVNEAERLTLQACDVDDPEEIRRRIGRLLQQNPLNVTAWCLLASQEVAGGNTQIDLYQRAVAAAMTITGIHRLEDVTEIAPSPTSHSLARALAGLADALRRAGKIEDAIAAYHDVLRVDREDGLSVRYALAECLLDTGYLVCLQRLLKRFSADKGAAWRWTAALAAFKLDRDEANDLLEDALDSNPYIGPYLLDRLNWIGAPPIAHQPAEENEAAWYAGQFSKHWSARPQARRWIAERTGLDS